MPRMAPGAFERMNKAVVVPSGFVDIRCGVPGFIDKKRVLRVGDCCLRNLVRRQLMRPAFPFVIVLAEFTGAIVAIRGFIERIGSLAFRQIQTSDKGAGGYRNERRRGEIQRRDDANAQAKCRRDGDHYMEITIWSIAARIIRRG